MSLPCEHMTIREDGFIGCGLFSDVICSSIPCKKLPSIIRNTFYNTIRDSKKDTIRRRASRDRLRFSIKITKSIH